VLAVNDNEDIT